MLKYTDDRARLMLLCVPAALRSGAAVPSPFANSANKPGMLGLAPCAICVVVPIIGVADCYVDSVNCLFVLMWYTLQQQN